jgi:hypothetical protein
MTQVPWRGSRHVRVFALFDIRSTRPSDRHHGSMSERQSRSTQGRDELCSGLLSPIPITNELTPRTSGWIEARRIAQAAMIDGPPRVE